MRILWYRLQFVGHHKRMFFGIMWPKLAMIGIEDQCRLDEIRKIL